MLKAYFKAKDGQTWNRQPVKFSPLPFLYIGLSLDFDRGIVLYRINTVWSFSGISELLIMSAPATVGSVTNNGDVARTEYLIFSPE